MNGYEEILSLIAKKLVIHRENFPMTIIYFRSLQYCGIACKYFHNFFGNNDQYVNNEKVPAARLFAQFLFPQTRLMKKEIIEKIKKKNSRIRVLFAFIALGMGVNVPYFESIIHISPQGSLKSYMQEIGRAGRIDQLATTTLYYNMSDISNDRKSVDESL